MGGVRIGGVAVLTALPGPPFSQNEGAIGGGADQVNVWIVDADGNPLRITPYTDPTCSSPPCADEMHTPRLNPAGTQVAYCDFEPDSPFGMALWVVPADGSATYPITPLWSDGGNGSWANHPCWNPAGNKIVFTYAGPDGGSYVGGTLGGRILEVTYPGGSMTNLWTPQIQSPTQRESGNHPIYSPDGTKIAFLVNVAAGGGGTLTRQGLWVMDADGSNDQVIDNWSSSSTDQGCLLSGTQLDWSSDSEWIAYIDRGFSGGGTFSAYKIRPDGSNKTLLMEGIGDDYGCYIGWGAWLPDDSAVIVAARNVSGGVDPGIYLANADGSGVAKIVDDSDGVAGFQNFETCYRLDNRIYWVRRTSLNGATLIYSCALDGTDLQTYYDGTSIDAAVANGTGFEWV